MKKMLYTQKEEVVRQREWQQGKDNNEEFHYLESRRESYYGDKCNVVFSLDSKIHASHRAMCK